MRIGIDARLYSQTGVGRYLQNLISNLEILDKFNSYYIFLGREDFDNFKPKAANFRKILMDIRWHTFSEQIKVPLLLNKYKIDLMHFPYFNVPVFYTGKYLLTIHDLIVDHFDTGRASTLNPILYRVKRLGYHASIVSGIKRASLITVISKTTKKEIVDHYRVPDKKIFVTYDALDEDFKNKLKKIIPKRIYPFPYILYVGNAYPHKNLERLFKVFSNITKKEDIKLVCAGNDNFFYPRLKILAKKLKIDSKVVFFGKADNDDLVNLYSFCKLLVFPSLMEGFGLPTFEALYCKKLACISDIPVFREIWDDKLPLFNPIDERDMEECILSVLRLASSEYLKKVEKASPIIERYSWRINAKDTMKYYSIAGK